MASGTGAKNKSCTDETVGKKKVLGEVPEDTSNAAILLALREQEERLAGKVKLAVREAVEEMLAGEIQALKTMIEASNSTVNKLSGDIAQQVEVGSKLQGRLDATSANIRAVKHDVGDIQKEVLSLCQKVAEMEDRSRRDQSNRPRTLIFRLLRNQDREKILNGARALSSAPTHQIASEGRTSTSKLLFFPRLQRRYRAEEESLRCGEKTACQQRTAAVSEISSIPESQTQRLAALFRKCGGCGDIYGHARPEPSPDTQ
ncbi:hypothetical protein D5F01_LYC17862 [Larimichthys crocea]|uniref:Uncharacterized protein n=1 Tax=Larimichthys crocea TaxID=215358 RepID=A0A6G0HZ62_LARCR|nr:hypothetical protein D5F01_LYC17862 [Larimichthys crocea]